VTLMSTYKRNHPTTSVVLALAVGCPLLSEAATQGDKDSAASEQALEIPAVEVIGKPEALRFIPGSAHILEQETLFKSHVFTPNEALRKVPGVNVRDEEGLGIRPNIGIRGMNPVRSTKTLLLEDGLPLSYAPYGDNASYYHPPVERFDRIEVLKGPGQIMFGPQTTTGTINYITPDPPLIPKGFVSFIGGNRDYYNGHINYGGTIGKFGGLLDILHKESDGARDNTHIDINDFNLKGVYDIDAHNALTLRANYFQEFSQVTYTGITDAEMRNFGIRYNPFKNDFFDTGRWGTSLTHKWMFNEDVTLTTSAYWSHFHRDWWRQSSTTTDDQCGNTFRERRLNGQTVDPDTTCKSNDGRFSNQGRLRDYYTYGVEPRLHVTHQVLGIPGELDAGFRAHYEEQYRRQENGAAPKARSGTLIEDNERYADAYSGFLQNRFILGDFSLTPGVRVEHVSFERKNLLRQRLNQSFAGEVDVTEVLPAFGINYNPAENVTAFFGFHRGFGPPRAEDAVSNFGNAVDVGPEKSWNYELGVRTKPIKGAQLDATLFHADFQQQNAVGSIAGGATPLATGKALYEGLELFGRLNFGDIFDSEHNVYLQTAYTWVGNAETLSPFQCLRVDGNLPSQSVCPGGLVSGSRKGNRLPYAPEHLLTATVGYAHPVGFDIHLETVFVDEQFSDFANFERPEDVPTDRERRSGQFGKIEDYVVLNLATTYHVKPINTDVFVSVKNLLDETYIVDRTRGILPGAPRLVQAGFRLNF
jgi:Fe(3+) dicitrate transport protein